MVVIERDSVRVMVFDPDGRVLLLHTTDPADPERGSCLELPGGGVYPGESIGDAARRELYEETGIEIDDVGACVAVVEGAFSFGGRDYRQREHVFRVGVPEPVCRPAALRSELERAAHRGHRWWHLVEVRASKQNLYPPDLPELMKRADDGAREPA
jgi:8-oxo-dGTP pyrophosphatase MutT (NUDIX family)